MDWVIIIKLVFDLVCIVNNNVLLIHYLMLLEYVIILAGFPK